jgi:hypothetical protein
MTISAQRGRLLGCVLLLLSQPALAVSEVRITVPERIDGVVDSLLAPGRFVAGESDRRVYVAGSGVRVEECGNYPYHDSFNGEHGFRVLVGDVATGLRRGLQCLAGQGPAGALHPFHEEQALALLSLLESELVKTFRCVEDRTSAYAVAKPPPDTTDGSRFDDVTADVDFPAVVLDTFRISGFLTRRFEVGTYRDFFKLDDPLIEEHLTGQPQRLSGIHRIENREALLFHEMIHWLGHVHSNLYPDVVDLYEACCFGGDDRIPDPASNARFQRRACDILRDDELWSANHYRQMRLWRYRGYDRLKRDMRDAYGG